MDGIEEYHAKWNKPSPKNQRLIVFPDKWMMIYNGGWGGWGVKENGRTSDYGEGNEREEGMKDGGMRQTSLTYVHVWLHKWYESTSVHP